MGFKDASFGKQVKAVVQLAGLVYIALTEHEQLHVADTTDLRLTMLQEAQMHAEFQNAFALVRDERGCVEVRRKEDGMRLGTFDRDTVEKLDSSHIMSQEEYDKSYDKLNQKIALFGGEAYRTITDEKHLDAKGKPSIIRFEKLQNSNRQLFNSIEGGKELIDLLNILSNGDLIISDRVENERGDLEVSLYDLQNGTCKTGDFKSITAAYFKELGYKNKELEKIFGKTSEIKKEKFDEDELLISAGEDYIREIYDINSILENCTRTADGSYVVENPDGIKTLDRAEALIEIVKRLHEIDDPDRGRLEADAIEYLCDDENIPDRYVGKYYDFLLQGQSDPQFRRAFTRNLKSTNERNITRELTRLKNENGEQIYTEEMVRDMTYEEKLDAMEIRAKELEIMSSRMGITEKEDTKITKEYDILTDVIIETRQRQLYAKTNELLQSVEEREAEEERERQRREREENRQKSRLVKSLGAEEYVKFVKNKTTAKKEDTMEGQEAFAFNEDGSFVIGEEEIADGRRAGLRNDEVRITAQSLTEEDFIADDTSELVSEDELDNIEDGQTTIFDYIDGNSNEMSVENDVDSEL